MIDLDITFFIQFVNFLITLVVLNLILIRPIREVIKKRAETMAARIDDIESFSRASEGKLAEYQAQLDAARRAGVEARTSAKNEAMGVEKEIVEAASKDASITLQSARTQIEAQVRTAMAALKANVDKLAQQAAVKILG